MQKAKQQLSGNWMTAAIGTLIIYAIIAAASFTFIGEFLLTGPLYLGYMLFIMCIADTKQSNFELLFNGFNRFAETCVAGIIYVLATTVGFALLIVPGIIATTGLSMTFYIMADDPSISGIDAIKQSWNMMQGHKMDLFCLWLRFIGWILLSILTCGIGLLWVYPYITAATFNYYRLLRYGSF